MDFVVRESRAVVAGQMAIVRLGTCGAIQPPAGLGNLIIAQSAINIRSARGGGNRHVSPMRASLPQ